MKIITENMKGVVWLIDRVGVPLLVCAFLAYLIWVKFEKLESSMKRLQRNQIAAMKHLKVPIPSWPQPEPER